MKLNRLVARLFACCFLVAGMATQSFGAIEFRMESVTTNQLGPVSANIFMRWDGNGLNTISAIEVDLTSPSAGLAFLDGANDNPPNPLAFDLFGINTNGSVAALAFSNGLINNDNFANVPLTANVDTLLTTLNFNATAYGTYEVGQVLVGAFRNGRDNLTPIPGEITLTLGTITVVPEPSSMALIGLVAIGGFVIRRRR